MGWGLSAGRCGVTADQLLMPLAIGGGVALFAFAMKRLDKVLTEVESLKTAILGPSGHGGIIAEVEKLRDAKHEHANWLQDHEGRIEHLEGKGNP